MGLQTGNLACQSLKPDKNQIIAFTFYYQNLPPSLYDSVHHHMGHIHTLARDSWPEEGGYYDGKGDDDFENNGADYDDDDNSRVIAVRTSSNRLGETDPSWLELFLELVLLGDGKSRSNVHLSVHQSPRTGSFQMPTPLPLLQLGLQLLPGILPHLLEGKEKFLTLNSHIFSLMRENSDLDLIVWRHQPTIVLLKPRFPPPRSLCPSSSPSPSSSCFKLAQLGPVGHCKSRIGGWGFL